MLKNITLSADEALIREARRQAALHNTTLNELFRAVLSPLCGQVPSRDFYERALQIRTATGYAFYDALIVTAAIESGCRVLYTEDLEHDRVVQSVRIVNPFLATDG